MRACDNFLSNLQLRVSALLTNGAYILNLYCNHYVNNSKAFLEAMCFMMDPNIKEKACFVQFPQRFNGGNASDSSNHSTVFYDVSGHSHYPCTICGNQNLIFGKRTANDMILMFLFSFFPGKSEGP